MRINSIHDGRADVTLDAGELVLLSNVMHEYEKNFKGTENQESNFFSLYSQVVMASNITQYGGLDTFAFGRMLKHRLRCGSKDTVQSYRKIMDENGMPSDRVLTDEEVDCFNSYLDDKKDGIKSVAYGNSDWNHVYNKITGGRVSERAKGCMEHYRELSEEGPFK